MADGIGILSEVNGNPQIAGIDEFNRHVGKSYPRNIPTINSWFSQRVACNELYVSGNTWLGPLQTALSFDSGIALPDGALGNPSLRFINWPQTGIYSPAANSFSLVSNATTIATVTPSAFSLSAPLTTSAGDLFLNPAGANVDFGGKNIVNVGSISTNPRAYDVIADGVLTTIDATPLAVLTIPTISNAVYNAKTTVSTLIPATGDAATFTVEVRFKNIAGVLTITVIDTKFSRDPVLQAGNATIAHVVNATNVDVMCTGIAATNIIWFGQTSILRVN